MSEVTVRPLGEPDWAAYREIRLRALADAPEAFASSLAEEQAYPESLWRERMRRSSRLVAERDGEPVGVVSLGQAHDEDGEQEGVAEIFGMWVVPEARGTGVAWRLVDAAANHSREEGRRLLKLWVSVENPRAVAFYSSYGFRPGDERRPMTTDTSVQEISMTLALRDGGGLG